MLQLQAYLPAKVQEILPEVQDFLIRIQIEKYLTLANTLKAIGAIGASYIAYKTAKILALRRKYAHIPGPKTSGLYGFFLGNIPPLDQMEADGKIFADYQLDWHKQFGPVIKFQILDRIMVSTIDPESIKEALVVKNLPKSTDLLEIVTFPLNTRFLGRGLVTEPDNKIWREHRTTFNPGFHRNVLMNFVKEFNVKADILMERLRTLADGKTPFKLFPELNHTTLDAIAMIAFGMNIDSINNEKDKIFNNYMNEVLIITGDLFKKPLSRYSPTILLKRYRLRKIVGYLRSVGKQKIIERLRDDASKGDQNDILAGILKSSKASEVDLEVMMDNFITFFLAGQETTANTLGFCFLELGKNKAIFDKCREEVDNVLGSRNEITHEDVTKLKYISSVFKETLRLYPPATSISRFTPEEMTINGIRIPANTGLSFSAYVTGRTESNFPNCLEYKPERFLKDPNSLETGVSNYTYFPFSIGPRNCIGQNFAQIEGIIILAKIVQSFDYVLAPNQSFKMMQDLTIKPKDGTKVIFSLRK